MIPFGVCLAVAQDPGGAEALAPVLKALANKGWSLSVLARRQAGKIFERAKVAYDPCDDEKLATAGDYFGFALRQLDVHHPQLLLTATSLEAGWERAFIRAAYQRSIPRITIMDAWSNERARFLEPGEIHLTEEAMPNRVTAVDEEAAGDLYQAGFAHTRVRVVGQPALDEFVRWARSSAASVARRRVRQSLHLSEGTRLLVFFSQPIAEMSYAQGSIAHRGYDQFQVVALLQAALSHLHETTRLVVKLHPKERSWPVATPGSGGAPVTTLDGGNGDELIVAADVVVGMTSTALVKGALAGHRILSIQPGLQGRDPFVLTRRRWIKPITYAAELAQAIRALDDRTSPWSDPIVLPPIWTDGQATQRIVHVVSELLGHVPQPNVRSHVHPVIATA